MSTARALALLAAGKTLAIRGIAAEYSEHILRAYHRTALSPGSWAREYASGQTTNKLTTATTPNPTG